MDIIWETTHPLYKDMTYHPHVTFYHENVCCRIEKLGAWPFGHVYRVVCYSHTNKGYGFTKWCFSLTGALSLKDKVFNHKNSYGFK